MYLVNANLLNLRAAPDLTAAVLGVLPRGHVLEPTPDATPAADWLRVETTLDLAVRQGWVARRYLLAGDEQPTTSGGREVTVAKLQQLTPAGNPSLLAAIEAGFAAEALRYGIDQNARRVCHFLAQAAHESMGFTRLHELGGPSYWRRYEGRADLGNVQPGDGVAFHGRGIFQLTGRANYAAYGQALGVDLVSQPDRAADPALSLRIACLFWYRADLNGLADADDLPAVTRRINGGSNGLAERRLLLVRARSIWS